MAVERTYELKVNGEKFTTVLLSPSDIEEFAYGYLISEGIVKSEEKIKSLDVNDRTIEVVAESPENIQSGLELRSSGGMGFHTGKSDGLENTEVTSDLQISPSLVLGALKHLATDLYERTSGSHSACLIDRENKVISKAVDVGRHNAFDKAIGKGIKKNTDFSETVLLGSGRQSSGMVMKAANAGIPVIVSKAAPLSSGIKTARKTKVTLICFADGRKFKVFSGKYRIKR